MQKTEFFSIFRSSCRRFTAVVYMLISTRSAGHAIVSRFSQFVPIRGLTVEKLCPKRKPISHWERGERRYSTVCDYCSNDANSNVKLSGSISRNTRISFCNLPRRCKNAEFPFQYLFSSNHRVADL